MKTIKMFCLLVMIIVGKLSAQDAPPAELLTALKADDAAAFTKLIAADKVNNCYRVGEWDYSLLSLAVKANAQKCFSWMIEKGVDVNKSCNGYVPALMHAAKYGRLEMVKTLVAKGANTSYKYEGDYNPAKGMTPLAYAEANNQAEVVAYLKSLP